MYYMKGLRSKPKNEDSTIDYTNLLNKDVLRFINNKELKPFTVDEFPEEELKD